MSHKIDMIGVQCNHWEVISEGIIPDKIKNKSSLWWNCKCLKCGRIKSFNGTEIRLGRIGECHCDYQYARPRKSKQTSPYTKKGINGSIINEVGHRYGKLVVKSFGYTQNGFAYWNCQCDCGNVITTRGNRLRNGRVKSCGCIVSFKEQEIEMILKNYIISFKREYTFSDLKDKGFLRFDFAILNNCNELIGLIEYQGAQHFESSSTFNHHGLLQKHDKMKLDYCKENNIPILYLDKNSQLEKDIIEWYNKL